MALGTTNISTTLVGTTLGTSSRDVGTLCTHPAINKWSKYKPVRLGALSTDNNEYWFRGENINNGVIRTIELPDLSTILNYTTVDGFSLEPIPSNYPKRLGDFRGYDHYALPPLQISNNIVSINVAGDGNDIVNAPITDNYPSLMGVAWTTHLPPSANLAIKIALWTNRVNLTPSGTPNLVLGSGTVGTNKGAYMNINSLKSLVTINNPEPEIPCMLVLHRPAETGANPRPEIYVPFFQPPVGQTNIFNLKLFKDYGLTVTADMVTANSAMDYRTIASCTSSSPLNFIINTFYIRVKIKNNNSTAFTFKKSMFNGVAMSDMERSAGVVDMSYDSNMYNLITSDITIPANSETNYIYIQFNKLLERVNNGVFYPYTGNANVKLYYDTQKITEFNIYIKK